MQTSEAAKTSSKRRIQATGLAVCLLLAVLLGSMIWRWPFGDCSLADKIASTVGAAFALLVVGLAATGGHTHWGPFLLFFTVSGVLSYAGGRWLSFGSVFGRVFGLGMAVAGAVAYGSIASTHKALREVRKVVREDTKNCYETLRASIENTFGDTPEEGDYIMMTALFFVFVAMWPLVVLNLGVVNVLCGGDTTWFLAGLATLIGVALSYLLLRKDVTHRGVFGEIAEQVRGRRPDEWRRLQVHWRETMRAKWRSWGRADRLPCPYCKVPIDRSKSQQLTFHFGGPGERSEVFAAKSSARQHGCKACGGVFESRPKQGGESAGSKRELAFQWRPGENAREKDLEALVVTGTSAS